ncbi:protein DpdF [Paenibacillus sp. 37]|uniref:protein DpdF n=1 Tax=Paenibacillus sp. 37 TaxID=2607911 RepID=UPI00122E90AE|nr:protein DpdF [Paenibacillus sp. 37]
MNRCYEIAEEVLQGRLSPENALEQLQKIRNEKTVSVELRSATSCLVRLFQSMSGITSNQGTVMDLASHLRQLILTFQRKIVVNEEWVSLIQPVAERFGLVMYSDGETDIITQSNGGYPYWISSPEAVNDAYQLTARKQRNQVLGDGVLHSMTRFTHYQSPSQKQLVQSAMQMLPGETLTICLPTGGGKSLVSLLPTYFDTEGGTLRGGVRETSGITVVIVPTVGLAIDQKNAANKYFSAREEKFRPQAYRSEMPQAEKDLIFEGVKEGTIPILFTSPESLILGPLGQLILTSAQRGQVNRFVIDEAHIVVDWGNSFRTGFQLLSAYHKQLLERSDGKVKTILMSATLTPWTSKVLKDLFAVEGKYTEVRCDALRYEPAYMVDQAINEEDRFNKITRGIGFLPRPLILYVNTREHAAKWIERLKDEGYVRVNQFTGETKDDERRELLRQWNDDGIDIMVATSAFGMGVDKADIRTIIHCGIPESLNRYYQEVGRSGRDGFASVSLVCYIKNDVEIVQGQVSKQFLTADLLVDRWIALFENAELGEQADEMWLNMATQREHLKHTVSGARNENWNVATVLLMVRNGLLELLDFERTEVDTSNVPRIKVRALVYGILNDAKALLSVITPERESEKRRVTEELEIIKEYIFKPTNRCLSDYLIETYPYSETVCGGCTYCVNHSQYLRYNATKINFPFQSKLKKEIATIGDTLFPYLIGFRHLLMTTSLQSLKGADYPDIIQALINTNVRTIVLPPLNADVIRAIMEQSPDESKKRYYLFLQQEELQYPYATKIDGPVAIIYPPDLAVANIFYSWMKILCSQSEEAVFIHIVDPEIKILNEGKSIRDLLDHLSLPLEEFLTKHQRKKDIALY